MSRHLASRRVVSRRVAYSVNAALVSVSVVLVCEFFKVLNVHCIHVFVNGFCSRVCIEFVGVSTMLACGNMQ